MSNIIWWIVAVAILAAVAAALGIVIKAYMTGESPTAVFFKPRPEPRLAVIEFAAVDQKRRLVLIRRDDVEHLIMTGGPVDVVVETGIRAPEAAELPRTAETFRAQERQVERQVERPLERQLETPVFSQPQPVFAEHQQQQVLVAKMERALKR